MLEGGKSRTEWKEIKNRKRGGMRQRKKEREKKRKKMTNK